LKEYTILMNQLEQYNPELLDKHRIVAVSKCELLDEELKEEIRKELKEIDEPILFFSS
jgi:GTPase